MMTEQEKTEIVEAIATPVGKRTKRQKQIVADAIISGKSKEAMTSSPPTFREAFGFKE